MNLDCIPYEDLHVILCHMPKAELHTGYNLIYQAPVLALSRC